MWCCLYYGECVLCLCAAHLWQLRLSVCVAFVRVAGCVSFASERWPTATMLHVSLSLCLSRSLSLSFFRQGNGVEDCSPTPRASAPPTVAGGHGGKRLCWQGPQPSRAKYLEKRDEGGTPANWKHASVRKEGNSLMASKEKEVRELKKSTAMCGGRLRRPVLCYSLVCG